MKVAVWGILGTTIGLYFTDIFGGEITAKIFGGLLILMGLKEIFTKNTKRVAKSNKNCYTKNE